MNIEYIASDKNLKPKKNSKSKSANINIYKYIKRLMDIVIASILLVILLPVIIAVSICIKIDSKGSVLFKQLRAGKDSKDFYIYKFRSMELDAPSVPTCQLKEKGCKVTRVGKFIRKTSLDEIPQLYNILKGDMSFVGPRPVINDEMDLIDLRKECEVDQLYPGITGWAQINGRDEITIYEKVKYDYEYYKKISLKFDIYIMLVTVIKVLKSEGIKED